MMKKRHFALLLVVALSMSCNVVNAQKTDKAAISVISQAATKIRTMQCDFVQTKQLKMLNEKMVSRGTLSYQQSDKLRWEYLLPYKYTFVLNGNQVYIKKGERADKIDVNQSKVFKEIARIMMNTVVGKVFTDTRDFATSIENGTSEYIATLVPQRKDMRKMFKTIRLHFNKKEAMVTRIELSEHNGDQTVIELKNVKTNIAISAKTFGVD